MKTLEKAVIGALLLIAVTAGPLAAQGDPKNSCDFCQSLDDAWWTGPMLAPSAATLPRGHFLIEPYLYDVTVQGHYDSKGTRRGAPYSNGFGSLTYILYGVANKFSIGVIPTAGYNTESGAPSSTGVGLGDVTLQAQYRLRQFHEGSWLPTASIAVQETIPTGEYDNLSRASNGFGSGAMTTTVALYTQTYFWLPNGRILRMRLNMTQSFSNTVNVAGASVYGTDMGFRGYANPGDTSFLDASWEYSVTKKWVLALDATYRYQGNTFVKGFDTSTSNQPSVQFNTGFNDAVGLAPAVEYSWKHNLGVLLGVRLIPFGRNTNATVTPAVAVNYVH
jgi:hypothetical protein